MRGRAPRAPPGTRSAARLASLWYDRRLAAVVDDSEHDVSRLVEQAAHAIIRYLRAHPEGASKEELQARVLGRRLSPPTIQRAMDWLRDEHDAPIDYEKPSNRWLLKDSLFGLPLGDPTPEDLAAVVFAGALLARIADEELSGRVQRLIEQMDMRILDPHLLSTLLRAVGRHVLRIDYRSPWREKEQYYDVEPWQLRFHDGSLYMRGYSRTTSGPRNYRVANVVSARIVPEEQPREPVPAPNEIWPGHPAFGIDDDRPDTATIRIRGAIARWVARTVWHPEQKDTWIEKGELLERRVPYNSCREFARRLLTLGDGLVSVAPAELRHETHTHALALSTALKDE
jgi:predicted DNA-binding transcriptional regulator YafY